MGIVRTMLAIVVILAHAQEPHIHLLGNDGGLTVLTFFVISGFYMALITPKYRLNDRKMSNIRSFYANRAFRIFPTFWFCSIATILLGMFTAYKPGYMPPHAWQILHHTHDKFLYAFENIFIFGQEITRFLTYNPSSHGFILDPLQKVKGEFGSGFPVLGQAWSLSIELTFYLLVPVILTKSTRFLAIFCALSMMIRFYIFKHPQWQNYNVQHAFFPSLLCFFLLGALSFRLIYTRINPGSKIVKYVAYGALLILGLYATIFYNCYNYNIPQRDWQFIILVTLSLPFLFSYFKNNKIDNWIGELSYPLYMTHFLVIGATARFFYHGVAACMAAFSLSIILIYTFIKPIDRFRNRQFLKKQAQLLQPSSGKFTTADV